MALSTPTRTKRREPAKYEQTNYAEALSVKAPPVYGEVPVMDRNIPAKTSDRRGAISTSSSGFNKRDDKDRKPGTRVPFHEPDPDRLAKAEALRQAILAQERRRWGSQERDPCKINRQPAPAKAVLHGAAAAASSLPDVPVDKVWPHYTCLEESAAVRGERDGVVLFFGSAVQAQTAMTGRTNNGKNIANAASGITRGAYGWKWTRLRRSPTGPKSQPVRGRGGK